MNNQQRAAMQMALEALEAMLTHMGMDEDEWNKPTFDQAREAITALREALAQPQGEWVDLTDDEIEQIDEQGLHLMDSIELSRAVIAKFKEKNTPPVVPQSEPVYYQWRRKNQPWSIRHVYHNKVEATTDDSEVRELYTAPPQREWVEPSDEQIVKTLGAISYDEQSERKLADAILDARAILKLSKELNHV